MMRRLRGPLIADHAFVFSIQPFRARGVGYCKSLRTGPHDARVAREEKITVAWRDERLEDAIAVDIHHLTQLRSRLDELAQIRRTLVVGNKVAAVPRTDLAPGFEPEVNLARRPHLALQHAERCH